MQQKIKDQLHQLFFGISTPIGKRFDIALIILISLSIVLVMLDSIPNLHKTYHKLFTILEWIMTILFTIEYLLRIWIRRKPWEYILSFYGIIDLLAILPTFIALLLTGTHSLVIIRSLRLLRVFRLFKLSRYTKAGNLLVRSLSASKAKITVFLFVVILLVIIIGTLIYLIEGEDNGFDSIPKSIYWAIVTLTTVGYGDLSPATPLGQFLACIVMIMGYGIIAVPTGIVSAEIVYQEKNKTKKRCPNCNNLHHSSNAKYCHQCGTKLIQEKEKQTYKE